MVIQRFTSQLFELGETKRRSLLYHIIARCAPVSSNGDGERGDDQSSRDRKSTRLNSSHANISYAVFCLKKKNKTSYQARKTLPRSVGREYQATSTTNRD